MSYQHIIPYNNMLQDIKRAGGPKKYKEQISLKAYFDGFVKGRNQGIKEGQRVSYAKATILGLSICGIGKGVAVLKSKKKETENNIENTTVISTNHNERGDEAVEKQVASEEANGKEELDHA